jgi:hypothetical protein
MAEVGEREREEAQMGERKLRQNAAEEGKRGRITVITRGHVSCCYFLQACTF